MGKDSANNQNSEEEEKSKTFNILLVENDFDISDQLERILNNARRFNCDITVVRNGEDGLGYTEDDDYDIIMADYQMEDTNGIDFLKRVKEEDSSEAIRILIMEEEDKSPAESAIKEGVINQYLGNPWNSDEVRSTVCEELQDIVDLEREKRVNVDDAQEAINTVKKFQEKIMGEAHSSTDKETLIFEFESSSQFNKFSYELKRMKNVQILDVNVFENKYVINVGMYPESYEKIS